MKKKKRDTTVWRGSLPKDTHDRSACHVSAAVRSRGEPVSWSKGEWHTRDGIFAYRLWVSNEGLQVGDAWKWRITNEPGPVPRDEGDWHTKSGEGKKHHGATPSLPLSGRPSPSE